MHSLYMPFLPAYCTPGLLTLVPVNGCLAQYVMATVWLPRLSRPRKTRETLIVLTLVHVHGLQYLRC